MSVIADAVRIPDDVLTSACGGNNQSLAQSLRGSARRAKYLLPWDASQQVQGSLTVPRGGPWRMRIGGIKSESGTRLPATANLRAVSLTISPALSRGLVDDPRRHHGGGAGTANGVRVTEKAATLIVWMSRCGPWGTLRSSCASTGSRMGSSRSEPGIVHVHQHGRGRVVSMRPSRASVPAFCTRRR